MKNLSIFVSMLFMVVLLGSCGKTNPPSKASLIITFSGLPAGIVGQVYVTGPHDYRERIRGGIQSNLEPGNYALFVYNVESSDTQFVPQQRYIKLTVRPGNNTIKIVYRVAESLAGLLDGWSRGDDITAVRWSPDGQYLAAAQCGGVWILNGGSPLTAVSYIGDPWGEVTSIAWSPTASQIAVGLIGKVGVYSIPSGAKIAEHHHSSGEVFALGWSPTGNRIASAAISDNGIDVWDPTSGAPLLRYTHQQSVLDLMWSPNGAAVASAGQNSSGDPTVDIWNSSTGSTQLSYTGQGPFSIWAVAWSPNGTRIASAGAGVGFNIWSTDTGQDIYTMDLYPRVTDLDWSSDGDYVAIAHEDNLKSVMIYDVQNSTIRETQEIGIAETVSWEPSGAKLAAPNGRRDDIDIFSNTAAVLSRNGLFTDPLITMSMSPGGDRVFVSDGAPGNTYVLSATTGNLLNTYTDHLFNSISASAWSSDGRYVFAGDTEAYAIYAIDAVTGEYSTLGTFANDAVAALATQPSGTLFAVGTKNGRVNFYDAATFSLLPGSFWGVSSRVTGLSWAPWPDNALPVVAISYEDGTIVLWIQSTNKEFYRTSFGVRINDIAWSPSATEIAAAGDDGRVYVFDAGLGDLLPVTIRHGSSVSAISWSPDGTKIATAGSDGAIRIWNALTGLQEAMYDECFGTFNSPAVVEELEWSSDGSAIAYRTSTKVGMIYVEY